MIGSNFRLQMIFSYPNQKRSDVWWNVYGFLFTTAYCKVIISKTEYLRL